MIYLFFLSGCVEGRGRGLRRIFVLSYQNMPTIAKNFLGQALSVCLCVCLSVCVCVCVCVCVVFVCVRVRVNVLRVYELISM